MDRTDGQNYIDIGGGRRGFRDQNVDAGVPGTRVTAAFLNSLQEEILTAIENAGITPAAADWSQLDAAIRKVAAKTVADYNNIALAKLNALPWLPVISLTQKKPPAKPTPGDLYVVPFDGTGEWSDKGGQIAEWTGQKWLFSNSRDGHGIGLPDGKVYIRVNGTYRPFDFEGYRIPLAQLNRAPFVPVISMSLVTPPASPTVGDMYLVGSNPSGAWAGKADQLAEWSEKGWLFTNAPEGHGVGLSGEIYNKINGKYWPQLALDSQSGKWVYAEATGTANALTANLNPAPFGLWAGAAVRLKIKTTNTGPATLNLNGLGAKPILNVQSQSLSPADLLAGSIIQLIFDGSAFVMVSTPSLLNRGGVAIFKTVGAFQWPFPAGVTRVWAEVYGAGGGGCLFTNTPQMARYQGEGGGGGGFSAGWVYGVPGSIINGYVGAAGKTIAAVQTNGTAGGSSTFGSVTASGGGGGTWEGQAGQGGSGITGNILLDGQSGGDGAVETAQYVGYGGDAAGTYGGAGASAPNRAACWPGGGGFVQWNGSKAETSAPADGGIILFW